MKAEEADGWCKAEFSALSSIYTRPPPAAPTRARICTPSLLTEAAEDEQAGGRTDGND